MRLNPLSIIADVVRTITGWTVVIFVTLFVGTRLGTCIGHGRLCEGFNPLAVLPLFSLAWLAFPQLLICMGVTALAWYVPIRCEGGWARIFGAAANLFAWMLGIAWAVRNSPWHF
jgi:hypothetical protein